MIRLLDLKCTSCGNIETDCVVKGTSYPLCNLCGGSTAVTWELVESLSFVKPFSQSLDNATGNGRNAFGADDDPICRQELFIDDSQGFNYTRLPRGRRLELLEKRMKDGDSPQLRKEILNERKQYVGKRRDD